MRVVGIHGINQSLEADKLKEQWLPSLNEGIGKAMQLSRSPGDRLLDHNSPTDFGMVAFWQLYQRPDLRAVAEYFNAVEYENDVAALDLKKNLTDDDRELLAAAAYDPDVLLPKGGLTPDDRELLAEYAFLADSLVRMWELVAELSKARPLDEDGLPSRILLGPNADTRRTPRVVQAALTVMADSWLGAAVEQRILVGALRQVRRFLRDPKIKEAILAEVDKVVTPETRVIVAHSLGSVVAYEALCRKPPGWKVHTLVTLGSPLGVANVVFHALTPKPPGAVGVFPPVDRWVNVADHGDIVALEKSLANWFGNGVEDKVVYNGWKSHASAKYLAAPEVGAAVLAGLR